MCAYSYKPLAIVTPHTDPAYQGHVANLDGGEGQSEHILFGSNLPVFEQTSKL